MAETFKVGDRVEFNLYKENGQKAFGVVTIVNKTGPVISSDVPIGVGVRMFNIKKVGQK